MKRDTKSTHQSAARIEHAQTSRRGFVAGASAGLAGVALGMSPIGPARGREAPAAVEPAVKNGRIKQSVAMWCFTGDGSSKPWTIEELCRNAAALGVPALELVPPKNWPLLKKYGLINAVTGSHGFVDGWNNTKNHEMCREKIVESVDLAAEAGFPNVITFSGFEEGVDADVGLANSVAGLKTVVGHAEKKGVTLILEVLNSRVDVEMKGHPGYMGDSVEWCVEVCKRVGSPRLKILFDIYHVQIMQGDIITRIKANSEYIGHYHTAGVPGRNEIDENQEINYPPIMRTIVDTGYKGYVGQEFIPTRDPLESLRQAVTICDV